MLNITHTCICNLIQQMKKKLLGLSIACDMGRPLVIVLIIIIIIFLFSSANFFSSYFQYVATCRFHFWYEISVRLCALKSDTVGPKSFFLTELLPLVPKTLLSLKLRNRKRQLIKCNEENVQCHMTQLRYISVERMRVAFY